MPQGVRSATAFAAEAGLSAAVASIENLVAKCGTSVEVLDLAERLVNVIEDEGVDLRSGRDGRGGAEEVRWPWRRGRGRPRGGAGKGGHGGPKRHGQGGDDDKGGHFTLVDAFGSPIVGGVPIVRSCSIGPGSMDEGWEISSRSRRPPRRTPAGPAARLG